MKRGSDRSGAIGRLVTLWPSLQAALLLACLVAGGALPTFAAPPETIAREVEARLEALGVVKGPTLPLSQQVLRVRRAMTSQDYHGATVLTQAVLEESTITGWRFRPFDEFVALLLHDVPSGFGGSLDAWVAREPTSALPLLLRAQYNFDRGWDARGSGFLDTVSEAEAAEMSRFLRAAHRDLEAALVRDPEIPSLYAIAMQVTRGVGSGDGFMAAYQAGIRQFPDYYNLHELMLQTLQPKWGGSVGDMIDFVARTAGAAPAQAPVKLLHLELYERLLSTAANQCRRAPDVPPSVCIGEWMDAAVTPELEQGVLDALALYDHSDPYQFGREVWSIISGMQAIPAAARYAGAVLELAAIAMHSDTQLERRNSRPNDYIIDLLVARSWKKQSFDDNAQHKYLEAIQSLRGSGYAHEDRLTAQARIYQELARAAFDRRDYVDQIAFGQAALSLGMPWEGYLICRGYVELEAFDLAIDACTEAVELTDSSNALYWRGIAHDRLGDKQAAIVDLTAAADRSEYWAAYAAVAMSMIFFDREDLNGALAVLNRYPVLYDADRTAASQIAVGYNNRCYALMELGQFQAALADCTQSLRYGNLPDAFRKQQELVELLKPED